MRSEIDINTDIVKVTKVESGFKKSDFEIIVQEYPLELIYNGDCINTFLCSPEYFDELALGFLITEGYLSDIKEIETILFEKETRQMTVFTLAKKKSEQYSFKIEETGILNSLKNNEIESYLDKLGCKAIESELNITTSKIFEFMEKTLNHSEIFKNTGGVHSIALADAYSLIMVREDVARHNALNKIIGFAYKQKLNLKDKIIVLSGRVSLEMLLKSARVGISIIISKSAPTTLSVKLAEKLNITLVGFVRKNKMNIYTNPDRIL